MGATKGLSWRRLFSLALVATLSVVGTRMAATAVNAQRGPDEAKAARPLSRRNANPVPAC